MATSQNDVCITQQNCHIMNLFHDGSMIKKKVIKKNLVFFSFSEYFISPLTSLKVPKCEIFNRSDFPDFYTIKSSWVGDLVVKILTYYFNF
jgi:hypothetical protein